MKHRVIFPILAMLALVACGCTAVVHKSPEMPAQRPDDFNITFWEVGGSESNGSRYVVNAKRASFERKLADGNPDVAEFEPASPALDSFYALIRGSGITSLQAQTEGEPSDRFGYQMEIVYAGDTFKLADHGNQFIRLEADYNRFKDVLAEVRAFVGKGLERYKFELTAKVVLDAKAPRPDSLSVALEATSLIDLQTENEAGDTLVGSFTALKGTYHITALAKVAGKEWTWHKEVLLTQPTSVNLQLGKDGFQEIAESVEK